MNPFNLTSWDTVEEALINGALVIVVLMIGYLLWEIQAAKKRRRLAKRDKDRDRWQDQ